MALTLNGKKKRLKKADFVAAYDSMKLDAKQQENIFEKMINAKKKWFDFIDHSFLSEGFKQAYKSLIDERIKRLDVYWLTKGANLIDSAL